MSAAAGSAVGSVARGLMRQVPPPDVVDGYVVAACPLAGAIGMRVLNEGGNAVDASVATALALAVTTPEAGNLGGGGFMLIHDAAHGVHCLDYRERAPLRVAQLPPDDRARLVGATSVAVPGTVAGLAAALERFGTWPWERLLAPSIDLAKSGFVLTARQALFYRLYAPELSMFAATRRCYLPHGQPPVPGTRLHLPELAATLSELASEGPASFYRGAVGLRIAAALAADGGVLDGDDLAAYRACWRAPISLPYRGRVVHTVPRPSGGGLVVAFALALCEAARVHDTPSGSPEQLALLGRVLRAAATERHAWEGDPDETLTPGCDALEARLAEWACPETAARLLDDDAPRSALAAVGGDSTTHFCAIDRSGNAVSNTYSLNTRFGSKLVAEGTGVLLNNSMDDFASAARTANYYGLSGNPRTIPAPGRRPTGSMAPTIVCRDGAPELLLGAAGGPRIPSAVVQLIVNVIGGGLALDDAMALARVHHQGTGDWLTVEDRLPPAVRRALEERGHVLASQPEIGLATGLHIEPGSPHLSPVKDPRYECRP